MKSDYFSEDGWLHGQYLWPLRQQIVLSSLDLSDYINDFGIEADKVAAFFDGYVEYLEELAEEDGLEDCEGDVLFGKYDNEQNLIAYFDRYPLDGPCPLRPNYVNVDIHWDFARSIKVIAKDEEEAEDIVSEMMRKGDIPKETFEATGDWELDTTYQPDDE